MARVRWVNGNTVAYGSGGWYRFVLDVDVATDYISVWWGVETNVSLSDSNNNGDTNVNGAASPFTNVGFSHGSGGGVTWLRGEGFSVGKGQTISFSGFVRNLADFSGGGGVSSVGASWTNPALPPNQMGAPVVNNIGSSTHQVHFAQPGANGTPVTDFTLEWHFAEGGFVTSLVTGSSPVYASGFTPNRQYAVRVLANSAAGPSAWSAFTYFTQAVAAPSAPGKPTVTRNSNTNHSLSWANNSSGTSPYASQEILRHEGSNGAWGPYSVIATISAGATSFVDTTTVANKAYEYAVRATNAAGSATSQGSGTVWTSPNSPVGQSAAKDAASNIVVTWSPPSGHSFAQFLKYEISESTDGGAIWTMPVSTAMGATSWTHTAPNPAVPHLYRVRAVVAVAGEVGSGLASSYVSTNTVQLLTPPQAPSNLASNPPGTANRAQAITLTWQHNAPDSTPQTKYTLQHRAAGTTTWTTVGPVTSAVSSYTLAANTYPTGSAFEWRVLTWGLHADSGPYSAIATTQISSVPGVSIVTPTAGGVVGGTSLTATWTFSDPDGDPQGSWEATLYNALGTAIETRSGSNTDLTTTFTTRLLEAAYSVKVRVRDSRGLWSVLDTRNFTVTYPLPPEPILHNAIWDWMRGTVELSFEVPAPGVGEVAPIYLEIWRSIDDGPFQRLVTNLPPATLSYMDFSPTVEGKNVYMIQAISDLPSGSQSDTEEAIATVVTPKAGDGRPGIFLNGGPSFTQVGRLATEVEVTAGRIRERVLQKYSGRVNPVEHSGEHVDETWQISGVLNLRWSGDVDLPASPEAWLALGSLVGPHLLRMPSLFGGPALYAFVSITGPDVTRQKGGNVHAVSFTAQRAEA